MNEEKMKLDGLTLEVVKIVYHTQIGRVRDDEDYEVHTATSDTDQRAMGVINPTFAKTYDARMYVADIELPANITKMNALLYKLRRKMIEIPRMD